MNFAQVSPSQEYFSHSQLRSITLLKTDEEQQAYDIDRLLSNSTLDQSQRDLGRELSCTLLNKRAELFEQLEAQLSGIKQTNRRRRPIFQNQQQSVGHKLNRVETISEIVQQSEFSQEQGERQMHDRNGVYTSSCARAPKLSMGVKQRLATIKQIKQQNKALSFYATKPCKENDTALASTIDNSVQLAQFVFQVVDLDGNLRTLTPGKRCNLWLEAQLQRALLQHEVEPSAVLIQKGMNLIRKQARRREKVRLRQVVGVIF